MIIYKLTNTVNGKVYIGQTIQPLADRMHQHKTEKRAYCRRLFHAREKYGWDAFEVEVLEEFPPGIPISYLNVMEEYYIALYDSTHKDKGYNILSGGLNRIPGEETRKLISAATTKRNLGSTLSEETKDKIRQKAIGRKYSDETKKKQSERLTGREVSQETRDKLHEKQKSRMKSFTLVSPEGEKVEGSNLCQFCKDNDLQRSQLQKVLKGERYHVSEWVLYVNDASLKPFDKVEAERLRLAAWRKSVSKT